MNDPYSVLGVSRSASDEDIKSAFRKLAMQHHPDRNPGDAGAEARFKDVQAAYDQIKDAGKRAAYENAQRPHANHFDFGGGPFGFGFQAGPNFDDIMRQWSRPRNRDIRTHCTISFQDALHGCDLTARLHGPVEREISVRIPAGVDNGTRIRVQGLGENGIPHEPPGDLYVIVRVNPDPRFHREGDTIYSEVSVDAIDLMLDQKFRAETVDGDVVEIAVPNGAIQSGTKMRLAGRGMPNVHNQQRGDHIVTVLIRTPDLNDRQREFLRQIKSLPD